MMSKPKAEARELQLDGEPPRAWKPPAQSSGTQPKHEVLSGGFFSPTETMGVVSIKGLSDASCVLLTLGLPSENS